MLLSSTLVVLASYVAPAALTEVPAAETPEAEAPSLRLQRGPGSGALGDVATVKIPEEFGFVDQAQMPVLNQLTGNLNNPKDIGALISPDDWIVFFSWDPVGYVKDDDKDELDGDALLETFKESESAANDQRRKQGFEPMYIVGWDTAPYYDQATNNLTWALRFRTGEETGEAARHSINHEVRLLGRRGSMSATLAATPEHLEGALEELGPILTGFSFTDGNKYAEYRQGDKIAEYGLTGLLLGGGVLVAAKTGLLAQLGKFIKVIVVGGIAVVAGLFKLLKRRFYGE